MSFIPLILASVLILDGYAFCSAEHSEQNVIPTLVHTIEQLQRRTAILEKTTTDLKNVVASQQTTIQQLETKLHIISQSSPGRYTSNKRLILGATLPVAFSASILPMSINHVNPGTTIPFQHVLTNYGGGYNASSSVFVAPLAGIYMISSSLIDHLARKDGTGVMLHANIMKNGAAISRVFAHAEGSSYRDQGAQTIIVELEVGDRVWVSNWNSPDLDVGGEMYSTFSGYLLWPFE